MHYQIHRGIGVHHHAALRRGEKLRASIFVGGPPAHALAAIMPLPEGIPEVLFGGLLAGRHFRYARRGDHLLSVDADFCITGTIEPGRLLPEGPFGDHLGYYSLAHDFPVFTVDKVYHRKDAIWPFTVVGRPPQEDAQLAALIHEIADGALAAEIPGLRAVHAVEAAGVHPLLLAIAEDRYAPFQGHAPNVTPNATEGTGGSKPAGELHTTGHAILGYGQMSLAKYLWIASYADNPHLEIRKVGDFFHHMLRRVSWESDLHFTTRTTMDTLDYSGDGLNAGSKLMLAVSGVPRRELLDAIPEALLDMWPDAWSKPRIVMPGVLVFGGAPFVSPAALADQLYAFTQRLVDAGGLLATLDELPLWVMADDPGFVAASLDNFLWVTFTRSDPARDVHGVDAFLVDKHWGCRGPLVIDARVKPWHAPVLEPDPAVARRVEETVGRGSLRGVF